MQNNVLLLGGSGFLGKNLTEMLTAYKFNVLNVDIEGSSDKIDMSKLGSSHEILKIAHECGEFPKIVMLASKIGADDFNANGDKLSRINHRIDCSFLSFLDQCRDDLGVKPDVTYYSTSEVYGSLASKDEVIDESTPLVAFPGTVKRFLYAIEKRRVEQALRERYQAGELSKLAILRPFNVSGLYQKRGVVYSMIRSGIMNGVVNYSDDTTRTITNTFAATDMGLDAVRSDAGLLIRNIADPNCSLTMERLATHVQRFLKEVKHKNCTIRMLEPDKYIRYRHVSPPNMNDGDYDILCPIFSLVSKDVK